MLNDVLNDVVVVDEFLSSWLGRCGDEFEDSASVEQFSADFAYLTCAGIFAVTVVITWWS